MHIGSGKFLEVAKAWDEATSVATLLFRICTQIQAGRSYHMRDISVYIGYVGNPCAFLIRKIFQATLLC